MIYLLMIVESGYETPHKAFRSQEQALLALSQYLESLADSKDNKSYVRPIDLI